MENFRNISLNELNCFLGTIALYSLNKIDSLGENVKASFGRLFTNNDIEYFDSIAIESKSDIIIIDGDDFNPSKVFGLTKKYENPVVIFVSNSSKIEKLKACLIREVLIINKNTISVLNIEKDVQRNLKEKEEKELAKQKLLEQVSNDNDNDNKSNNELNKNEEESSPIMEIRTITQKDNIIIEDNKIVKVNDEFVLDLSDNTPKKEEDFDINENVNNKGKVFVKDFLKNNIKANSLGFFGLQSALQDEMKKIFPEVVMIKASDHNICDIYFLDISYASNRIFKFIENVLPSPMIIMSSFPNSLQKLKYINCASILIIDKPYNYELKDFKKILVDYLNGYNLEQEAKKIENFNKGCIPLGLEEDERIRQIREKYTKNEQKSSSNASTVQDTKNAINEKNKRFDKDISLEELYENLGLTKLATFHTKINRKVYSTQEGVVIKYEPEGYLIEIRLKKLKEQGLSNSEIGNAMQRLEEADIKFAQKQLRRIELYKLKNKNKNKEEQHKA